MGTKHPMSPNLSCFIEPRSSHHPFTLSCATTNLMSTPSPMQTTHNTLIPPPIIINHTPFINSFYQSPTLHGNVGPQPYQPFQLPMIRPPNLLSFLQHIHNLHLEHVAPHVGTNLPIEGQLIINVHVKHPIHLIQIHVTISTQYPPLLPPTCISLDLGFVFGCFWFLSFRFSSFSIVQLHPYHSIT